MAFFYGGFRWPYDWPYDGLMIHDGLTLVFDNWWLDSPKEPAWWEEHGQVSNNLRMNDRRCYNLALIFHLIISLT